MITVETMSDRKATMKELADVFVVLPGSYGTLDEMFDVIYCNIVGEHKKQLIVVNENGFYDDPDTSDRENDIRKVYPCR